jgi:hypothetical protein
MQHKGLDYTAQGLDYTHKSKVLERRAFGAACGQK